MQSDGLSIAHCTLAIANWGKHAHYAVVFMICLHFIFFFHPDSEIEDIDNDSDDNKGCVCVILWTCSINFYSTISAATKTMTREAKQFNGFELQHIHHMDMELEKSYVGLNI